MATQLEVLITARDEITGVLKKAEKGMRDFGDSATQAASKVKAASNNAAGFSATAERIDSSSRQARIGFTAMSDAARLAGSNISGFAGPIAIAVDAVGDLTGAVGALGASAGVVGVVVLALGALISKIVEIDTNIKTRIANVHKSFEELRQQFAPEGVDAATKFATAVGASVAQLQEMARASDSGAASINRLIDAQEKVAQIADAYARLADARRKFAESDQGDVFSKLGSVPARIEAYIALLREGALTSEQFSAVMSQLDEQQVKAEHSASVLAIALGNEAQAAAAAALQTDYAAAAARRLAEAMGDTRGDAIKDMRAGARSIAEMNTKAWLAKNEFKEGVGWIEKIPKASAAASKAVSAIERAAQQARAKLQGMVENALSPTAADPNMGNSWDEARKRFEAFASGTSLDAYGEEFQKQFEALGMSAQAAADAFKNFSLFADPENMKLIDWGPIVASVEQQLLSMAGKANVTAEAMRQVWANLSPTAKAALAEQGIENAGDAMQALVDPAGLAEEQVGKLGDAVRAIPTSVTTTFTAVTDSAKAAIDDLAEFLDKFINAYGTVTVSARGDFWAPAPPLPGEGTAGMGEYPPPPIIPSGNGGDVPGAPREIYNNRAQTNNMNIILPNVTTERDAHQIASALQRMSRNAMLRAAQGLV